MDAINDIAHQGYTELGQIIDSSICDKLMAEIKKTRSFDESLFMSEEDFEHLKPNAYNKNPRPGCNLLDDLEPIATKVKNNPALTAYLNELLGEDYNILRQKFVCGVPETWIPDWVKKKVAGKPSNNLAHFMKPEYTDITYFYGIDFHQDLVDWKDKDPDFVTVYVYIDDVSEQQAPLFVLPKSHLMGQDPFPHEMALVDQPSGTWSYRTQLGKEMEAPHKILTGKKGSVFSWHALTLHGTQPATVDEPRISIRYLIEKNPTTSKAGINDINKTIGQNLKLSDPRFDLNQDGIPKVAQNHLHDLKMMQQDTSS